MDFTVFSTNTPVIDRLAWQIWLLGLTADQAIQFSLNQYKKVKERESVNNTSPLSPSANQVALFITSQYRNFDLLEHYLHHPKILHTQLLFRLPSSTIQYLIESYYSLDEKVIREILGKKLTHRVRKDLDDVSDRTQVPVIGCRRMFDNLKRIMKRVEDASGQIVEMIHRDFLLPMALAKQYAHILFINNYRLDTFKKSLLHLRFSDFEYVASVLIDQFTNPTTNFLEELDSTFSQDIRDLKTALFNHKSTIDTFRMAVTAHLNSIGQEAIMDRVTSSHFKIILRNTLAIGTALTNSKEIRDLFISIQEKIVDVCVSHGWSAHDMDLFFQAMMKVFSLDGVSSSSLDNPSVSSGSIGGIGIHPTIRRRYSASFSRLVTAIRLSGIRFRNAMSSS